MSTFGFAHQYYKSSDISDRCKPYQINISGLKFANKKSSSKEKDLIKMFFRRLVKNIFFCKLYQIIDLFTII